MLIRKIDVQDSNRLVMLFDESKNPCPEGSRIYLTEIGGPEEFVCIGTSDQRNRAELLFSLDDDLLTELQTRTNDTDQWIDVSDLIQNRPVNNPIEAGFMNELTPGLLEEILAARGEY